MSFVRRSNRRRPIAEPPALAGGADAPNELASTVGCVERSADAPLESRESVAPLAALWDAVRLRSARRTLRNGRRRERLLRVDPLEDRKLLSLQPIGFEIHINDDVPSFIDEQLAEPSVFGSPFPIRFPASSVREGLEESNRSLAVDHDGDFVVTWTSYNDADGDGAGIFYRLFDRLGTPLTATTQVNTFTEGNQRNASVAMDADGDFVIVWQSDQQDSYDGSAGIYGKRFSANGAAIGDEFQIHTIAINDQFHPQVAMDNAGNFVVTWETHGQDQSFFNDVKAQRFNFRGQALGSEFRVNDDNLPGGLALPFQTNSAIAMDADGDFMIAWEDNGFIMGKLYGRDGAARTSEFPVSVDDASFYSLFGDARFPDIIDDHDQVSTEQLFFPRRGGSRNPTVAMDDDGNFTVAWESFHDNDYNEYPGADSWGIYMRRFLADGSTGTTPLSGVEINVNPVSTSSGFTPLFYLDQVNPSVAIDADGDLVVTYDGHLTYYGLFSDDRGIFMHRYNPAAGTDGVDDDNITVVVAELPGTPTTFPQLVNVTQGGVQQHASVAMEPDGDIVVVWSGRGPGDEQGIFARRYNETTDTAGPLATDLLVAGERVGDGDQVVANVSQFALVFDENMSTAGGVNGVHSVLNPNNFVLTRDGQVILGGIRSIAFAENTASNKLEAVFTLDGDGPLGNPTTPAPLPDGVYRIVARSTLRDVPGNPLASSGTTENGVSFSRVFTVKRPGGGEVRVNTTTAAVQQTHPESPQSVASDADGNFVVVWTGPDSATSANHNVFAQRYAPGGAKLGAEILVNQTTAGDQQYASVAMDADGEFVVTWSSYTGLGTSWDIFARKFNSDGTSLIDPLTGLAIGAFLVNTHSASIQRYSTVAMDADGDFVVTWQSYDQDGSGYGVFAQRYNAIGERVGGTSEVQTLFVTGEPTSGVFSLNFAGDIVGPITYSSADGGAATAAAIETALAPVAEVEVRVASPTEFVITFIGDDAGKNLPQLVVVGAVFVGDPGATAFVETTTDGVPSEFLVNETTLGNQRYASVAMDAAGEIVFTWTSSGQDGDAVFENNVYARRFAANETIVTTTSSAREVIADAERLLDAQRDYDGRIVTVDDPDNHLVQPGTGFDGVVMLTIDGGLCSGTLLSTGNHILTAAHCVTEQGTNTLVGPNTILVTFEMPGGDVVIGASSVVIHPSYDGNLFNGADVAVITLASTAPAGAERYDLYRGMDEVGKPSVKVGYGLTGTGDQGEGPPDGIKRIGQNRYDAVGERLNGVVPFTFTPNTQLVYDFDNGIAANDAFGTIVGIVDLGFGNQEVNSAQGDSGGPTFIDGLIAGVTSGGFGLPPSDVTDGTDSSFGEFSYDARVSTYAGWIDSVLGSFSGAPLSPEFLVNQHVTGDQEFSSVAMDLDGDFVITWTSYGQDTVGTGYGPGLGGENGVFARRFAADGTPLPSQSIARSYISSDVPLTVADTGFTLSRLTVPDSFVITDLNVRLNVTHERVGDINVSLTSPSGTTVLLVPAGLAGANLSGTALDDQAATPIVAGTAPYSGRFIPAGALAAFNGPGSEGVWTLAVSDTVIGRVGILGGWSLEFTGVVPFGNEFQVNTFADGNQQFSRVSMDADGDIVIAWESFQDDTTAPLGTPDSYGIYAQRFARSSRLSDPLLGPSGRVGTEFRANATLSGDQRYPGVASDYSGNFVIVWSGPGNQPSQADTNGGVFFNRFETLDRLGRPLDDAGPIVTDVLTDGLQVSEGLVIEMGVSSFVVVFSEEMSEESGFTGVNSVTNTNNWQLTRNGVIVPNAVTMVVSVDTGPLAAKVAYTVTFDSNEFLPGNQVLENGDYVLVIRDLVQDLARNALDGNYDGTPGGDFQRGFSIEIVSTGPPSMEFTVVTDSALARLVVPNASQPQQVATDDDGDFVVVWSAAVGGQQHIFAQRYERPEAVMRENEPITGTSTDRDPNPRPLDGPILVSAHALERNDFPSVAMDADGDFVVTWAAGGSRATSDIFYRVFGAKGKPRTEVRLANSPDLADSPVDQRYPSVAMDVDGDFVITWTEYGTEGDASTEGNIRGRRFTAEGSALTEDFRVNNLANEYQSTNVPVTIPEVGTVTSQIVVPDTYTVLDANVSLNIRHTFDGQLVVFLISPTGTRVQLFANILPLQPPSAGSNFFGTTFDDEATVAIDAGPPLAVPPFTGVFRPQAPLSQVDGETSFGTWTLEITDVGNLVDPSGNNTIFDGGQLTSWSISLSHNASNLQNAPSPSGSQTRSRVAMDADGDFVIVWQDDGNAGDTDGLGVFGQQFVDLAPVAGPNFQVNVTTEGDQHDPMVASDRRDGDFVVTWTSQGQDGDGAGIVARRFSPAGVPGTEGEILVNQTTAGDQQRSSVALDAAGDFVVTWDGVGQQPNQTDLDGVFYRRFSAAGLPRGFETRLNAATDPEQNISAVASAGDGSFVAIWNDLGAAGAARSVKGRFQPEPTDVAGPIVADVLIGGARLVAESPLVGSLSQLVVTFGEDMFETERFLDLLDQSRQTQGLPPLSLSERNRLTRDLAPINIAERTNWGVTRGTAGGIGGVAVVSFGFNAQSSKFEALLTLDANTSTTDVAEPFTAGDYTLTLRRTVCDASADNALDGLFAGIGGLMGTDFRLRFTIVELPLGAGPEVTVPSDTSGRQVEPAVAKSRSTSPGHGDYVVVWGEDPAGRILARRYDATGFPRGDQLQVNTAASGNVQSPDVAMDAEGNFVVVWSGSHADDSQGILARLFDRSGIPLSDEILVNTTTSGLQARPAVAADMDGDFVVTWTSYGAVRSADIVMARRFTSTGVALGDEIRPSAGTEGPKKHSDVAMDDDGEFFVITWSGYHPAAGSSWDVHARRFRVSDGMPVSGELQVNTTTSSIQNAAAVAMDHDGNFVVTWASAGHDGNGYGIYAQRFARAGDRAGGEFRVNTTTQNSQDEPAVGMDALGNFVIAWTSQRQDGGGDGVYARVFNRDGTNANKPGVPIGEFRVNTTTALDQNQPAVGVDGAGNAVIAWTGHLREGADLDGSNIYSKVVAVNSGSSSGTVLAVGPATFSGTAASEVFQFTVGAQPRSFTISLNGVAQTFDARTVEFRFIGGGGADSVLFIGGRDGESAELWVGGARIDGNGFVLHVTQAPSITLDGGAGVDTVTMVDSASDDAFESRAEFDRLVGPGYSNTTRNFEMVGVTATSGVDTAQFHGSAADETLTARTTSATFARPGVEIAILGFDSLQAQSGGGSDQAFLYDSAGDDSLVARPQSVQFSGAGFAHTVSGFASVRTFTSAGNDNAVLYDSTGDDRFYLRPDYAELSGPGFSNYVARFDTVRAYAGSGSDEAVFYDSAGDDQFFARGEYAQMSGSGYFNYAKNFDLVKAYAGQGVDTAVLYDSAGDDSFFGRPDYSQLSGPGYSMWVKSFESVRAYAGAGKDTAVLYDSAGNDVLVAKPAYAQLSGASYLNYAKNFDTVKAYAGAGYDTASLYDSSGDDELLATPTYARLTGRNFFQYAKNFDQVRAYAGAGLDRARLEGSSASDQFTATPTHAQISGAAFMNYARNFDVVESDGMGGADQAVLVDTALDDHLEATGNMARFTNQELQLAYLAYNYRTITAQSTSGHDTKSLTAIDFLLEGGDDWLTM